MNTVFNPDNWMDVFTILFATAMVAIPSWFAAKSHRTVLKLDKSVSNGHEGPLRADVDEIRDTLRDIRQDQHVIKQEVTDIRTELREERKDRLELDNRFERYKRAQ